MLLNRNIKKAGFTKGLFETKFSLKGREKVKKDKNNKNLNDFDNEKELNKMNTDSEFREDDAESKEENSYEDNAEKELEEDSYDEDDDLEVKTNSKKSKNKRVIEEDDADDEYEDELEKALDKENKRLKKKELMEEAKIPKGMTKQEYRAQKRKDRIKNFAILFLTIMLLLTFFSGTIRNITLPMVATAYVSQGEISPQIRGTGTVSAGQPYNIVMNQTRTIAEVMVKAGDSVSEGDTIYKLEDAESEELEKAKDEAQSAKDTYELAMFDTNIPAEDVTAIRNGKTISISSFLTELDTATKAYQAALKEDTKVQADIDMLNYEKTIAGLYVTADEDNSSATTASTTMSNADITYQLTLLETNITEQTELITELTSKKSELLSIVEGYTSRIDAGEELSEDDNNAYVQAQLELDKAVTDLYVAETKKESYENEKKKLTNFGNLETRNASYYDGRIESEKEHKIQTAQALTEAEKARTDCLNKITAELKLVQLRRAYEDAKETVDKLTETAIGAEITAPVSGTISSLAYTAGEQTKQGDTCAVIQLSGKAMTMSISVTTAQAAKVKVGDEASPQNAWAYTDFKATLKSITNDTTDPSGHKLLNFEIESSEITAGESVSIVMGEKSVSYDLVVPNSAIREDNNGKFILIVNSKSSPMGNRYIAERVDVEVTASDDTNSAINANVESYSYVITTSTAPISSGDQVRLSESDL